MWLQEGSSGWGAIPLAAAILSNTKRIGVGTGIVSPFRRHPLALAEDAAALNELSGGRFTPGIGSGPAQLKAMGIKVSQLEGLKDAVEIMRRLLKGDQFLYPGKVFRLVTSSSLEVTPSSAPPIYIGALMPRMIELAAEIADGLLISRRGGSSPRYVEEVTKQVRQVRQMKQISGQFVVRSFIESSIDNDGEKARQTARKFLASYTIRFAPRAVVEKAGFKYEDVAAMLESNRSPEEMISEEMIQEFSMSGTPKECLKKLKTFEWTRLDVPILYIHGPSSEKALELAGTEILPEMI